MNKTRRGELKLSKIWRPLLRPSAKQPNERKKTENAKNMKNRQMNVSASLIFLGEILLYCHYDLNWPVQRNIQRIDRKARSTTKKTDWALVSNITPAGGVPTKTSYAEPQHEHALVRRCFDT